MSTNPTTKRPPYSHLPSVHRWVAYRIGKRRVPFSVIDPPRRRRCAPSDGWHPRSRGRGWAAPAATASIAEPSPRGPTAPPHPPPSCGSPHPQRAVVGILKGLRPSLDRAVTKDDPFDPMAFAEQPDQVFLRQLAQAVGAGRSSHGLVGDHRRDRSAADRARRIPDAALERIDSAGLRIHGPAPPAPRFSLALSPHFGAHG